MYILLERLKYFDAIQHDFMNFKQMGRNKGNVETGSQFGYLLSSRFVI